MRRASHLAVLVLAIAGALGVFAASAYALGSTSVSPTTSATPPSLTGTDTTAPVTTSDVHAATYPVQAVITLTATDSLASGDTGCWGVAYVYYRVDSGAANDNDPADGGPTHVVALTTSAYTDSCTVTIPGPAAGSGQAVTHTIEYWSQDAAGNVESATSKTFTITPVTTAHLTIATSGVSHGVLKLGKRMTAKGMLTPASLAGKAVTVTVQRKRGGKWVTVKSATRKTGATGAYSWRCKLASKGRYRVRAAVVKTVAHTAATTAWRNFKVR